MHGHADHPPQLAGALKVCEKFVSLQGEGELTGMPSSFIRLSGCNLRCAWCDTAYASWSPEGEMESIGALCEWAHRAGPRHVVVTGGEPMIFKQLDELCEGLRTRGLHITIETAGTVFRALACDLMSISPKLSNSTPAVDDPRDPEGTWAKVHNSRRLRVPALSALIEHYPKRQFKFVVAKREDIAEIDDLLARLPAISPVEILLMPEGVSPPSRETKQWVGEVCVARGWRYCTRLHIELYGNTRGT
jgi:7-carboxy-7-deazaguanine synthase